MKKPDPINKVHHNDEFSSGLMEQYGQWMDGDCFQNTEMPDLHEEPVPFAGMDPQSNGAEIEDVTKKKKDAKKPSAKAQLATNEEVEDKDKHYGRDITDQFYIESAQHPREQSTTGTHHTHDKTKNCCKDNTPNSQPYGCKQALHKQVGSIRLEFFIPSEQVSGNK